MSVIHITFDHPDGINKGKTKAVKNLVSSENTSKNIVFSLNRTINPFNSSKVFSELHGYTIYNFGLPYGILLISWMFIAYRRIAKIIHKENIKPTLIHAHKLTFEGIIAFFLSRKLKVPFILTIRGNSDLKLLYHKRLYRKLYISIVQKASKVIFLAPWTIKLATKYLGEPNLADKKIVVPNFVAIGNFLKSEHTKIRRFISVFNFKSYKSKNIKRVIKAFDSIFDKYPEYGLDIVGSGPNRNKIITFIKKSHHPAQFCLLGEIDHSTLLELYSKYEGFILPSFPETFGLVFLEALTAGIPVIYSRNSGIDGYFDDLHVGIGVNHRSIKEITLAIEELILNNAEYVNHVELLITNGFFNQFSQTEVGEKYSKIIAQYSL